MTPTAPDVRVGQVWADNDVRTSGRRLLRVTDVVGPGRYIAGRTAPYAVCVPASPRPPHSAVGGRITRIALTRFKPTSTGYRLIADAKDPA